MYTDAVGVALYILFVNAINEMKCEGLASKNYDLSCKIEDMNSRCDMLLSHIYWLELGLSNVERENNELFNYIFNASLGNIGEG